MEILYRTGNENSFKGKIFKEVGVSDLVIEGNIFFCDRKDAAEIERRVIPTGPSKITFLSGDTLVADQKRFFVFDRLTLGEHLINVSFF